MKMNLASWFYLGTLVSSIGSFTFNICLVAFMMQGGFDLFHVSLILGLQRLIPVVVTGLFGHITDELSPRLTIVTAELGAAVASFGILWAWSIGHNGYWLLVAFSLVKTSIVAFQIGSKAKVTKLLADSSYASNANHAIWFNKATQGATLFAGLCAWPIIKYMSLNAAIWFDLATFTVNGLIVFFLPITETVVSRIGSLADGVLSKFVDFYRYNRRAAGLDFLLAVSMMGTTSFTARLVGDDQKWMALLIGVYGVAVWLAGYIERSDVLSRHSSSLWIGLATSYALLGFFPGMGWTTVGLALSKDTFYWLILHRISSHIQMDTPQEKMGAVTSARFTQMVLILATGELLVGSWSKVVPVLGDGLWRATFCAVVLALLSLPRFQAQQKVGYARL